MNDYGDLAIRWWFGENTSVRTFKGIPANFYMTRNLQNNVTNMLGQDGRPFKVEQFRNVWHLEFHGFKWGDFGGLQLLPELEEIWMFGNHDQHNARFDVPKIVKMLNTMPKLRSVLMGMMNVRDLAELRGLGDNIEELTLFENRIANVKALSDMTRLSALDLSGNQIRDISPLANLQGLRYLNLTCVIIIV